MSVAHLTEREKQRVRFQQFPDWLKGEGVRAANARLIWSTADHIWPAGQGCAKCKEKYREFRAIPERYYNCASSTKLPRGLCNAKELAKASVEARVEFSQ